MTQSPAKKVSKKSSPRTSRATSSTERRATHRATSVRTAALFTTGGSQAVRLPKEFRFEGTEVQIRRVGQRVILEPLAGWPREFLDALGSLPGEEIPRPGSRLLTELRNPWD